MALPSAKLVQENQNEDQPLPRAHILVATPLDFRPVLKKEPFLELKVLVLDEADKIALNPSQNGVVRMLTKKTYATNKQTLVFFQVV